MLRRFISSALCLSMLLGASVAAGQEPPPIRHPWASFSTGAWKRVRVVTETLDGQGQVTGATVTQTNTTLEKVDAKEFLLRVETTVEVAGKRFASQPQLVRQGFYGELSSQTLSVRKTGDVELSINGRPLACDVREITINGDGLKRLTVMHYSDRQPPHVLKSLTTITTGESKTAFSSTTVEAVALNMPYKVLAENKSTSFVRTVHMRADGGSIVTLEVHCPDVPGSVVAHTSKESNAQGQVIQRSTLELVDYGQGAADENVLPARRRMFHRSRPRPPHTTPAPATGRP